MDTKNHHADYAAKFHQHMEQQFNVLGINFNQKHLAEHVNFSMIVILVLGQFGMQPIEGSISDLGNFQNTESEGQTNMTQLQQLLSEIQGAVNNSDKGLPSNFWSGAGGGKLKSAAAAANAFFNANTQNKPLSQQFLYFRCPDGSYLKVAADNPKVVAILNDAVKSVTGEPFGEASLNKNAPSNLVELALKQLQTKIDSCSHYLVQSDGNGGWELKSDALSGSSDSVLGKDPSSFYQNDAVFAGAKAVFDDLNVTVSVKGGTNNLYKDLISLATGGSAANAEADFNTIANNYWAAQNQSSGSGSSKPTHPMADQKWLSDASGDMGTAQSYFQTQTQKNTSQIQQDSSQLTSYDQVGQSIVSDASKALQNMVQNEKSA